MLAVRYRREQEMGCSTIMGFGPIDTAVLVSAGALLGFVVAALITWMEKMDASRPRLG